MRSSTLNVPVALAMLAMVACGSRDPGATPREDSGVPDGPVVVDAGDPDGAVDELPATADNGTWVLLGKSASPSQIAVLEAALDRLYMTSTDLPGIRGVELKVLWSEVEVGAAASAIYDFSAIQAVADKINTLWPGGNVHLALHLQYKAFGPHAAPGYLQCPGTFTGTAVQGCAGEFWTPPNGTNANGEYMARVWDEATQVAGHTSLFYWQRFLTAVGAWVTAHPRTTVVVFDETACSKCQMDPGGYSATAYLAAVKGYLLTLRQAVPASVVVDQFANFFPSLPSEGHPKDEYWIYDLGVWGCQHHIGLGGPDAPAYQFNQCGTAPSSIPVHRVMRRSAATAADGTGLAGIVHTHFNEQFPDIRWPQTLATDAAFALGTLKINQLAWIDTYGAPAASCSAAYLPSLDLPQVLAAAEAGMFNPTPDPTWDCAAIPSNGW